MCVCATPGPSTFQGLVQYILYIYIYNYIYICIPAPSNRSPLAAFGDLKVAGGDLLEGAGL